MFDELKEKASTLAKLGSFYNRTLNQDNRPTANKLTHVVYLSSLLQDYNNISKDLTGLAYKNRRLKEFTYTDEDIEYCTFNTKLSNGNYTSPNYIPNFSEVSILPEANQSNINNITLATDYQFAFVLNVPKDIYVRIIRLNDGSVLTEGLNFRSQFGKILLRDNPITLFNGMGFIALSYTQRDRNIMCYPLLLQDIYGDVSYVIDYYKNNQSLVSFKRALYQAIGLPVSNEDGYITDKVKLVKGCSYISNSGKHYDAEFDHNELSVGSVIKKGKVIAGEGMVKVYLPSDAIPADITHVALNSYSVTGDKEIYIKNSSEVLFDELGKFIPKNFVIGPGRDFYVDYVNYNTLDDALTPVITGAINKIEFLRNVVAANRCIIILIDELKIPYDMAMKLKSFVIDHAPIGSVIAYCDGKIPADPPTPTIVTIGGELTKGHTQDSYKGLYHAFAFKISESDGIITWDKEIDSNKDITIKNIVLTTPDTTNSKTTSPTRLALYQADEAKFIAVSDSVEWLINTTRIFTFGSDAKVKFTDNLMFVFVHPDTTQEQLLNPVDTGLSVEDDDFTLAAWYIKVMSDGSSLSYPYNWGVISSASLNYTNRQYMPMFTMQVLLTQYN